jgi:hypothetical protein
MTLTQPNFRSEMWYAHRARLGARLAAQKTAEIYGVSGFGLFREHRDDNQHT